MCKLCMAMSENIEGMPVQARYVDPWLLKKVHARCATYHEDPTTTKLCAGKMVPHFDLLEL